MIKISFFFAKNKCKSADMGSSTVQLHGRYANSKLIIKTYFCIIKYTCDYIIQFLWKHYNIRLQGLDIIDTYTVYTNSIVKMYFYMI